MSLQCSRIWYHCLVVCIVINDIFSNHDIQQPTFTVVTAIRGGNFDYKNKFNYQVSIQKLKASGQYEHGCGGSIIGKKYILTAAHCFISKKGQVLDPTNGMRIFAGTSNLHNGGIARHIVKVFIPKNYRHEDHLAIDDIAVVQLQHSLFASSNSKHHRDIQIIPLFKTFNYAKLENRTAIVSGFGITERNATSPSVIRKYLEVKVTKERNCTELSSIVCVFSQRLSLLGPQGFCHGDSGGPVVIDGKVLGIVSRGAKADCDLTSKIGKLTLVPYYLEFIKRATNSRRDKPDIVILPDMMREAETIFKPAAPSS